MMTQPEYIIKESRSMRAYREALAYDEHFQQAGFIALLRDHDPEGNLCSFRYKAKIGRKRTKRIMGSFKRGGEDLS